MKVEDTRVQPCGETDERYRRSREGHERARRTLAGGVASAFRAPQLPVPITFARAHRAHLTDIDGNEYVDYALAFGPMLLGHSCEPVLEAIRRQLELGVGFGASHPLEAELAEAVCRTVPCAELCVFSNSGSEAVHAALRIARAATGRNRVVKFLGHFHGWLDPLAVGNPGRADARPATAGQDPLASGSVTVCAWNDVAALEAELAGNDVAAVIMEAIAVNGGCLVCDPGYLEAVRELTRKTGTVLIFDEVITGFRLALGGAQERLGVAPDLAVLGKALGGGMPISAVCGSAAVMDVAASGQVAHVGTTNANPVCAAAALAAIGELEARASELYPQLEREGAALAETLRSEAQEHGIPLVVNQVGAAAHAFWSDGPVTTYADTLAADGDAYRGFAQTLLGEGIHVIPRGLLYLSVEHGEDERARMQAAVHAACATTADALGTG
ncbi:MAG: aspartate aminotransferase family protein [Gaiellaceae bacterium]